jgi:ankyrin repeat protein
MPSVVALYEAMEANDHSNIRRLLERNSALVEAIGETPPPIHWAIWQDKAEIVDLLLDHGADIERRDPDRNGTPLGWAIVYGRPDIIRLLTARGADLKNDHKEDNMLDLALRGAAGAFEEFSDVDTSKSAFEDIVALLRELGAKSDEATKI